MRMPPVLHVIQSFAATSACAAGPEDQNSCWRAAPEVRVPEAPCRREAFYHAFNRLMHAPLQSSRPPCLTAQTLPRPWHRLAAGATTGTRRAAQEARQESPLARSQQRCRRPGRCPPVAMVCPRSGGNARPAVGCCARCGRSRPPRSLQTRKLFGGCNSTEMVTCSTLGREMPAQAEAQGGACMPMKKTQGRGWG